MNGCSGRMQAPCARRSVAEIAMSGPVPFLQIHDQRRHANCRHGTPNHLFQTRHPRHPSLQRVHREGAAHYRNKWCWRIPDAPKAMSLRVVGAMRESVEDAFDFPNLFQYVQYSFRSEVCFRETLGALRMPRLATVLPQMERCQQVHGPEKSNALFQCVRAVVRSAQLQL